MSGDALDDGLVQESNFTNMIGGYNVGPVLPGSVLPLYYSQESHKVHFNVTALSIIYT